MLAWAAAVQASAASQHFPLALVQKKAESQIVGSVLPAHIAAMVGQHLGSWVCAVAVSWAVALPAAAEMALESVLELVLALALALAWVTLASAMLAWAAAVQAFAALQHFPLAVAQMLVVVVTAQHESAL